MAHFYLRRIGPDGVLALNVQVEISDGNRQVTVTLEPADLTVGQSAKMTRDEWARFVDGTAGGRGDRRSPSTS